MPNKRKLSPVQYVQQYVRSAGYNNRLNNTDFSNTTNSKYKYKRNAHNRTKIIYTKPFHNDTGFKLFLRVLRNEPVRSYNRNFSEKALNGSNASFPNIIYEDRNPGNKNYSTPKRIVAHEAGHLADGSMETMADYTNRNLVPKQYLDLTDKQSVRHASYDFDETKGLNNEHDRNYHEIYGDLMDLRYDLYDKGIYDSRGTIKFNQNHLDKYKQTNPKDSRILKGFDDNTIIDMINTIAQNNAQYSDINYAKFGGQINKRRKAEYGEESIVLPEANVIARRPRWYNRLGKVFKQIMFPGQEWHLDEDGRYVTSVKPISYSQQTKPYSKQHEPFNFNVNNGEYGHEKDNVINVTSGKSGERDFLQMMGLNKLEEGKYLYKNRNKSEQDNREYLKWCAENANLMNRNFKKPTAGNAWTRHGIYGDSAIVVNPNVNKKDYSEIWGLNFNRVNKDNAQYVEDNIDNTKLENGDIVDMAHNGSYGRKAYIEGEYNRANSHTGTIINRNGNTYVFHYDGNGKIKMDPIGDLIGNSIFKPTMITGIRRPGTKEHPYTDEKGNIIYNKKQFGGQMRKYNPRHKAFVGAIINAATNVASGIANAVMQHKQQLKQNRQDNYEQGLQTAGVLDQLIANQDVVNEQLKNKVAFKYGGRKKCELGGLGKGILFSALTGAGGIAGAFADRAVQKHDMNQVQILPGANTTTTQTEQKIQQQPVIDNSQQTSIVQTDTTTPYDWNGIYNAQLNNNSTTTKRFGGRTQMFMCGGRTKRNRRK